MFLSKYQFNTDPDQQRISSHEAMPQSPTWVDVLDSLDDRDRHCSKPAIRSCRAIETLETSLGLQQVTVEKLVPYSGDLSSLPPLHLSGLYLGLGTVLVFQAIIIWNAIRSRKRL
jgi:hypothetical protein